MNPRSPTEPQTQKTSGFFNLPPPPYNPKSVGPASNHKPVPSVCLRSCQPGHPLATQPTSPLLTFPLSFSPPSNHLHPAASVIQTQIKPWSSLTESAPMTSQQASNNAQRPRTPQAHYSRILTSSWSCAGFLLIPTTSRPLLQVSPAPRSYAGSFHTSVSSHMPHPWRLTGPPLK